MKIETTENKELEVKTLLIEASVRYWEDAIVNGVDDEEEDFDLQDCPNCNSEAVGYDGNGSVPFLECFQCDHNWIP